MSYKTASPDRYDILKAFARENRKNTTLAEGILWDGIRNNALGHKFLRQHTVGDYIVDFLCSDGGLILEVDGGYHSEPRQMDSDEQREKWLEQHGYTVMRFTNEEVLNDLEKVITTIEKFFK